MASTEVEVITSERRRRHWSRADKERVAAAALQPGTTILGVARALRVHSPGVPLALAAVREGDAAQLCRRDHRRRSARGSSLHAGADRSRDRDRDEDPDQRYGGCRDGDGSDRGTPGGLTITIPIPSGTQVWLATDHTDIHKGFDGPALLAQETLKGDSHGGHLLCSAVAAAA
ncbi:protein of unknown function [Bradyrhizobium sp. ORS 285]|uniref:hypothetical protein n=1 Tax=Bradyrhizobium sp. ORS 285 TaxID=115808 RepID=UPI0002407907|nr:hypothetical protein BRAO285_2710008 [Bradyrhizobium sp. ORS 285]SMX56562.1 protein of unknown function [Bradyrhizobium sp. ORS 285]